MRKGKDLFVKKKNAAGQYVTIASSRSCDIYMTGDVIEVSSPNSAKAREYRPGRTSWRVTVGYLVKDGSIPFANLLTVGTEVELSMTAKETMMTATEYRGKAIVTACNIKGNVGSLVEGNIEFTGTGELKLNEKSLT